MTSKVSTALEAHHVLALTEFLAKCSGLEELREKLQSNRSLVINTISLLKLVHQSAKTDENLSVLNKLRSEQNFSDHNLMLLFAVIFWTRMGPALTLLRVQPLVSRSI